MVKLLSTLALVFAIVLFPPAVLAVVSNNAVPGDLTYPIKRGLEDIIYAAFSVNRTTKTWFAGARSDRRYQEITILATKGKKMKQTLQDLVEQTQITADQINQVSDPVEKEKLINQLSDSIAKYDAGLAQIAEQIKQPSTTAPQQPLPTSSSLASIPQPNTTQPSGSASSPSDSVFQPSAATPRPAAVLPQPTPTLRSSTAPGATFTPQPTPTPRSSVSPRATVAPLPTSAPVIQQPTQAPQSSPTAVPATPRPTLTPAPSIAPSPTPRHSSGSDDNDEDIKRARDELERIRREAEERRGRMNNQNFGNNNENDGNNRNEGNNGDNGNRGKNENDRNKGKDGNNKKGRGD